MKKIITAMLLLIFGSILISGCGKTTPFLDYDAAAYATIGQYRDMTLELNPIKVEDEDVLSIIKNRDEYKKAVVTEEIKDRGIQESDVVDIQYTAYDTDDNEYEQYTNKSSSIIVGDHAWPEEFETSLMGKLIDSTTEFDIAFEDDFNIAEFQGKTVKFSVTVNKISKVIYPELTDEFVKKAFGEELSISTYDELFAKIRELLEAEALDTVDESKSEVMWEKILENTTFTGEYPKRQLNEYAKRERELIENAAAENDISLDKFLSYYNLTIDTFDDYCKETAQNSLKSDMVLCLVAEACEVTVTNAQYRAFTAQYSSFGFASEEAFISEFTEEYLKKVILQECVNAFLVDNNTYVYTWVDKE